jgi:hypothetical protein
MPARRAEFQSMNPVDNIISFCLGTKFDNEEVGGWMERFIWWLLTCWTPMYGGHIYEEEISSPSLEEFVLGTEEVLYNFIRVWLVTVSLEVNAELRRKKKVKNYAQSLIPTHVTREKCH